MNTSCSIIVIVTLTTMLVSACAPSMAAASLPATPCHKHPRNRQHLRQWRGRQAPQLLQAFGKAR
jgi:hypothetical protein